MTTVCGPNKPPELQLTERVADEFASLFLYWVRKDREERERAEAAGSTDTALSPAGGDNAVTSVEEKPCPT